MMEGKQENKGDTRNIIYPICKLLHPSSTTQCVVEGEARRYFLYPLHPTLRDGGGSTLLFFFFNNRGNDFPMPPPLEEWGGGKGVVVYRKNANLIYIYTKTRYFVPKSPHNSKSWWGPSKKGFAFGLPPPN
jgi:hypothetical protein